MNHERLFAVFASYINCKRLYLHGNMFVIHGSELRQNTIRLSAVFDRK